MGMPGMRKTGNSGFFAPLLLAAAIGAPALQFAPAQTDERSEERSQMVDRQIEARGVRDPQVLEALRRTPRHLFVPPELAGEAYVDSPLPIGHGQTISQPYIVGLMSELLKVEPDHKVLEIGTGSGYQAAILAQLADQVFTIEYLEPLGRVARERLERLRFDNVEVRIGDGYKGWPEEAPFDRILLTAAPEELPQALVDQLAPGGRLVAPIGPVSGIQTLRLVEKDERGRVTSRDLLDVRFVPMVSSEDQG